MIYPGELTQVSPVLNRWLYDRAAGRYEKKWQSAAYLDDELLADIAEFARRSIRRSETAMVLDLGCGTGRGIRQLADKLPADTRYCGIDYSGRMLDEFRKWLDSRGTEIRDRVELQHTPLGEWAEQPPRCKPGLVCMLEVGEFLPEFSSVLNEACARLAPGGGILMTRPAGFWWLFFPTRRQSRKGLAALLRSAGLRDPEFRPWRSRYELVFATKPLT